MFKIMSLILGGANSWCELGSKEMNTWKYGYLANFLPDDIKLKIWFVGPEVPEENVIMSPHTISERIEAIYWKKEVFIHDFNKDIDLLLLMNPGLHSDYHESWMNSLSPFIIDFQKHIRKNEFPLWCL